jgi:hypothetical protein
MTKKKKKPLEWELLRHDKNYPGRWLYVYVMDVEGCDYVAPLPPEVDIQAALRDFQEMFVGEADDLEGLVELVWRVWQDQNTVQRGGWQMDLPYAVELEEDEEDDDDGGPWYTVVGFGNCHIPALVTRDLEKLKRL